MLQQAGRYRIERELGRGGMGVVYLAEDPSLHRKVAIKTIHFDEPEPDRREFLKKQLLRDARAVAALAHPNIVSIHDVIEEGDATYLVMEFIPGETLSARMRRAPPLDPEYVLRLLRETASALDYVHGRGIIHRDVKPANIMIDDSERVRIMDFGIARLVDHKTTLADGLLVGTVQYMSPEQIKGESLDGRTDQFSLAAVAYQLLTGHTLFESDSLATLMYKIVHNPPQRADLRNPALPALAGVVLEKALDRSPEGRYPGCSAFVHALSEAFEPSRTTIAVAPLKEVPRRGRGAAVAVGTGLLAVIGGGAMLLWKKPSPVPELHPPPVEFKQAVESPAPPAPSEPKRVGAEKRPKVAAAVSVPAPAKKPPDAAPSSNATPAFYLQRGTEYLDNNKPELAAGDFERMVSLQPNNPIARMRLGLALEAMHRDEEALGNFRRAAQLGSTLPRPHVAAGLLLHRMGRDAEAIHEFDKAIELAPTSQAAYAGRGAAKKKIGDSTAAEDLRKAKRLRAQKEP